MAEETSQPGRDRGGGGQAVRDQLQEEQGGGDGTVQNQVTLLNRGVQYRNFNFMGGT